jgi:hypothetical protein
LFVLTNSLQTHQWQTTHRNSKINKTTLNSSTNPTHLAIQKLKNGQPSLSHRLHIIIIAHCFQCLTQVATHNPFVEFDEKQKVHRLLHIVQRDNLKSMSQKYNISTFLHKRWNDVLFAHFFTKNTCTFYHLPMTCNYPLSKVHKN